MTTELRTQKKRKAPSASSPVVKKTKTTKPAPKAAAAPSPKPAPKAARAPRKTAADLMSDEESDGGWEKLAEKNAKEAAKTKKGDKKKEKKTKPVKAPSPEPVEEDEIAIGDDQSEAGEVEAEQSESEEEDDQTSNLLQGFESSDDEMDGEAEEVDGKKIVKSGIPNAEKVKKQLKSLKGREKTTPGIIYLGRVPHGFYEHEMRAYFGQFGTVTRLRLSRNKKTGKSKHYAFIEFSDEDVAKIVADTMNNYLLFGHILKCKTVPRDNLEYVEKLMKGANKRFKPRPGAKLAKAELEKKKTAEQWEGKVDKTNKKRQSQKEKWAAMGIEYDFEPPVAKKGESLPEPEVVPAVEAAPVKEVEPVKETVEVAETKKPVAEKKAVVDAAPTEKEKPIAAPAPSKKAKSKKKKTKA